MAINALHDDQLLRQILQAKTRCNAATLQNIATQHGEQHADQLWLNTTPR
jgi:hypothetical protein